MYTFPPQGVLVTKYHWLCEENIFPNPVASSWHIFEVTKISIPQLAHSPVILIKISALSNKSFLKGMHFLQSRHVAVTSVVISKLFHLPVVLLKIALKEHKKQSHNTQNGEGKKKKKQQT